MDNPGLIQDVMRKGYMIEPDAADLLSRNPHLAPYLYELDPSRTPMIALSHVQQMMDKDTAAKERSKDIELLFNYQESFETKGGVASFLSYFTSRYQKLSNLLRGRADLDGVTSIKNAGSAKTDKLALIGMVSAVSETKAGHYMLDLEDNTGLTRVILPKGSEGHKLATDIVYDEVIGITGRSATDVVFGSTVTFPGIPQVQWPQQDFSIALLSDTHVGSRMFMEEEFLSFIEWLDGKGPQAELAQSVKYVLIAGDLVDGCGVYKGQINELSLPDIEDQYNHFARLISRIPKRITTIICPGNHDATREAEPQPAIPTTFAPELYKLPNVIMVSSPSLIRLGGLTALMYHGTSLDSIIAAVPGLRKTGYDPPETAMLTLLNKRHLCPIYDEARLFSETEDQLVISRVPNILHMGHVHSIGASVHRGVRVINSGTFQSQTPFQAKIGHHPTPAIVPILDGNGKITLMDFNKPKPETRPESPSIAQ